MIEEYVTNISLRYCGTWDIWEAIRELCQNSLDETNTLPEFSLNGEGLTIRDNGEGITLKQLCLLGISEKKSTEARGQYGEGLKIALTIFVRKGYTVRVKSKDFICLVDSTERFNEKVLRYNYEETKEITKGLELTVLGFTEKVNFSERFNVNGNKTIILKHEYGEIIREDNPTLYVKNIYVKDLREDKALLSYDLKHVVLERDRNIPNMYNVKWYIGALISRLEDKEIIGTLLEAFRKDNLESQVEYFKPNKTWKETFYELYGDNATITDNEKLYGKARYHGFKTIVVRNGTIREGLNNLGIQDTLTAINLKMKNRKEREVKDLERNEKDNLAKALSIIKNATGLKTDYEIKIYESEDNVLGYANGTNLGLKREILKDLGKTITVLLEETIHIYYGIDDVTPELQQYFSKHMSQILEYVTQEREGITFNAKLIRTVLHVKGYTYYQYAVKIPLKHNDKIEGKEYITIKVTVE